MKLCVFLTLILSIFLMIETGSKHERSPASNLIKQYEELRDKVNGNDEETVFERFFKTFNGRVPVDTGKQMIKLNKQKDPYGSFRDFYTEEEFNRTQKEFYTNLMNNQLKYIEEEAKKDPSIKRAAESMQKNISPELEKDVGGFKLKTKADLLRGFASVKVESSWIGSEARYSLGSSEGLELLVFKEFNLLIPVKTEFCYRSGQQILESTLNASFSENFSLNVIRVLGRTEHESYLLQFDTHF